MILMLRRDRSLILLEVQICLYAMLIMLIIRNVISIMNKSREYSHFEDLKRIKSGYTPRMHFISLYNIFTIFMVSKLLVYRECKNFIARFFNYRKWHKKGHMVPFGDYDHIRQYS